MHFDDWNSRLFQTCGHYVGAPRRHRAMVRGHVRLRHMFGLEVADIACDIDHIDRTRDGILRDESEYIFLVCQISGRSLIEHGGRRSIVGPGEFYLLDSTRPARIDYDCDAHFLSVHMPRGTFLLQADGRLEIGRTLGPAHPLHEMLSGAVWGPRWPQGRSARGLDTETLYDLARIAFLSGAETPDGARMSTAQGRYELAVQEMERNLNRPELSLGWLARRIGISERQLQRDFMARGTSFIQLLRAKRLSLAAEFLSRFRRDDSGATVTNVALGAGFNDISNFNRAFKQRFGCSPTEFARTRPAMATALAESAG